MNGADLLIYSRVSEITLEENQIPYYSPHVACDRPEWAICFLQGYTDAVNDLKFQSVHANHAWLCLDLLEVLCQLAERGHATVVRSMLEYPLKHCPEVLILGIAHINVLFSRINLYFLISFILL